MAVFGKRDHQNVASRAVWSPAIWTSAASQIFCRSESIVNPVSDGEIGLIAQPWAAFRAKTHPQTLLTRHKKGYDSSNYTAPLASLHNLAENNISGEAGQAATTSK